MTSSGTTRLNVCKDPEECQQHHKHTTDSLMILLKQIVMIILLRQPENVARFINEHVFGNSYHLRYIVYSDYMRLLES